MRWKGLSADYSFNTMIQSRKHKNRAVGPVTWVTKNKKLKTVSFVLSQGGDKRYLSTKASGMAAERPVLPGEIKNILKHSDLAKILLLTEMFRGL